jgi:hypothetical protein
LQQVSKSSFAGMEIIVAKNEISNDNCLRRMRRQQTRNLGNLETSLEARAGCSLRKTEEPHKRLRSREVSLTDRLIAS